MDLFKRSLIKLGILYHVPKDLLNEREKRDIIKYGLVHFTFSKNIDSILTKGVVPGKEALYKKERNLCWFYIGYPDKYKEYLGIIRSKGERSKVDCIIKIYGLTEEDLNNMYIRRENDNAVVYRGVLKTNNMQPEKI